MPLQQTSGNATADAYGGGVAVVPAYIEDIFSTYLYTGTGSARTITNGIDLSGKGGLTWFAGRDTGSFEMMFDSARGVTKYLLTGLSNAEGTSDPGDRLTAYNSNGFSLGADPGTAINASPYNYVSWTFRKQTKFFDVVTYTGTGANRTITHNLGSAPRFMIVKRLDASANWCVYSSDMGATQIMFLNTTAAATTGATYWNSTNPTSTVFSVGTNGAVNASGGSYVAYLFASDAGGFGLTGTDNVITCGTYSGTGAAGNTITTGYEPQWLMIKRADSTGSWNIFDNMRGLVADAVNGSRGALQANLTNTESAGLDAPYITPTGFGLSGNNANYNAAGGVYVYVAIRRGPMRVPTNGAKVFSAITTSSSYGEVGTTNFVSDMVMGVSRDGGYTYSQIVEDRLRGFKNSVANNPYKGLYTTSATTELNSGSVQNVYNTGWVTANPIFANAVEYSLGRAPGFFDVVCYTGTGGATTVQHNLAAVPELIIAKGRNYSLGWPVYSASMSAANALMLNTTDVQFAMDAWNSTRPTSSVFSLGTSGYSNNSGSTYVAYLATSCAGVSKVGSYTGNGTTQTINCGFAGGARFVLIKAYTGSPSDWYVFDTARGMVANTNDAYLRLNSTAAESNQFQNWCTTVTTGFAVSGIGTSINQSGVNYIYWAIA